MYMKTYLTASQPHGAVVPSQFKTTEPIHDHLSRAGALALRQFSTGNLGRAVGVAVGFVLVRVGPGKQHLLFFGQTKRNVAWKEINKLSVSVKRWWSHLHLAFGILAFGILAFGSLAFGIWHLAREPGGIGGRTPQCKTTWCPIPSQRCTK